MTLPPRIQCDHDNATTIPRRYVFHNNHGSTVLRLWFGSPLHSFILRYKTWRCLWSLNASCFQLHFSGAIPRRYVLHYNQAPSSVLHFQHGSPLYTDNPCGSAGILHTLRLRWKSYHGNHYFTVYDCVYDARYWKYATYIWRASIDRWVFRFVNAKTYQWKVHL